jgi:glycosyltransferase involved in cell wall biosynthesis
MLTQYFDLPDEPGGSRHAQAAKHLAQAGHRVTVLTSAVNYRTGRTLDRCRGRLVRRERVDGVDVVRIWSFSRFRGSFRKRILFFLSFAAAACAAGLLLRRPDVLFATSTPLTIGIPGLWLARLWRRPLVFEVRDLWPDAAVVAGAIGEGRALDLARKLEAALYRRAVAIVCLTRGITRGIAAKGVDPRKLVFVPNGVDDWIADLPPRAPGASRFFRCIYVGALGVWNHCEPLVRAATAFTEDDCVSFEFVGEGDDRQRLEALATGSRNPHIVFTGALAKRDAVERIRSADLCLVAAADHPFHEGILPNKLFDYLGCGRPVLASARGRWPSSCARRARGWRCLRRIRRRS